VLSFLLVVTFCQYKGSVFYYEEESFDDIDFTRPPRGIVSLADGDCTVTTAKYVKELTVSLLLLSTAVIASIGYLLLIQSTVELNAHIIHIGYTMIHSYIYCYCCVQSSAVATSAAAAVMHIWPSLSRTSLILVYSPL
jgi:hypothetical protein